MIFNQDEHEIQVGTIDIEDGKDYVVLSIEGREKFEPTLVLTPQGVNANLNTFVVDRAQWGSIMVPIDGGVDYYTLKSPWVAKITDEVYSAHNDLKYWWKLDEDLDIAPHKAMDSMGSVDSDAAIAPDYYPLDSPKNPSNEQNHIQDRSASFQGDWSSTQANQVIRIKTNGGDFNGVVGEEATGNPVSISFWWRPTFWDMNFNRRAVILKFGSGWASTSGGTPPVGSYRAFTAAGGIEGVFQVEWNEDAATHEPDSYVRVNGAPPGGFDLDEWHHVVFTRSDVAYDGIENIWKIYVDGATMPMTQSLTHDPSPLQEDAGFDPAYIGDTWGTPDGQLADVAVWTTELSHENVKALHAAGVGGVQEGVSMTGQNWFSLIKRSTDIGDVTVQYQAIGASPLRVK